MHFQRSSRSHARCERPACQRWLSPVVLALFTPTLSQFSMSPGRGRSTAARRGVAWRQAGSRTCASAASAPPHRELTGCCCWDAAACRACWTQTGPFFQAQTGRHWGFWYRVNSRIVSLIPMLIPILSESNTNTNTFHLECHDNLVIKVKHRTKILFFISLTSIQNNLTLYVICLSLHTVFLRI